MFISDVFTHMYIEVLYTFLSLNSNSVALLTLTNALRYWQDLIQQQCDCFTLIKEIMKYM